MTTSKPSAGGGRADPIAQELVRLIAKILLAIICAILGLEVVIL